MLKNLTFAVAALLIAVGSAKADTLMDEIAGLDINSISDASAEIEDFDLDIDVDQLTADAGEETDAIEACFRRFGYRHSRGWGYGYRHCYRPTYSHCYNYGYNVCRPFYCHRPIVYTYRHCMPVITSYWGCY